MNHHKLITIFVFVIFSLTLTNGVVSANGATDLLIHHIESVINEDGETFSVTLIVSAISDRKNPLPGLTARDFVIQEDGTPIEIDEVALVDDTPINATVVMDMGATMQGERFRLASTAVSNLIKDLFRGDRVAIYAFNEDFLEVVPLTDDLNQARDDFEGARLSPSGGACLFDAIYTALERASSQPADRQAIVLLSSRKDTTNGYNTCSTATPDEILALSSEIGRHIPVYTISIGVDTDDANLRRIAEGTNGIYSNSTSNYDIADLLKAVSNRFISEYRITYTSTNSPGDHTLTVQLDNQSKDVDLVLPGLPPVVSVAFPGSPEEFEAGPTRLVLSLVERGIGVDSLTFKINDVAIGVGGKIEQPPYEFEVDFSQYDGQVITLTIVAQDQNGQPLSETSLELNFGEEIITDEEESIETEVEDDTTISPDDPQGECPEGTLCLGELQLSYPQLGIIGAVVVVLAIVIMVVIKLSKKKKGLEQLQEDKVSIFDDATLDGFALTNAQMGRLTILSSDDPLMVGKEFQLTKSPTTIGRSVNNDIPLPKDSAVSRKHVEIIADGGDVTLQEVFKTLSDGTKQTPTYGTYVNDRKISGKTMLHTGDEISLGRRTKLRYEGPSLPGGTSDSEDVTVDQIQLPDFDQFDDATRDG